MDWDKLRIFHTVAEAGSFTHAGERLNLTQSSVSRQISALEADIGVPLFHRHARGLNLTESGETLYRAAQDVAGRLAKAESLVTDSMERPRGPLRITTTVAFGSMWLTERLKDFVEMYPEIEVSLIVREDELNLSMRQADVAIRLSAPQQADLIQRHLFDLHHGAFASVSHHDAFASGIRGADQPTVFHQYRMQAAVLGADFHFVALRAQRRGERFRICT